MAAHSSEKENKKPEKTNGNRNTGIPSIRSNSFSRDHHIRKNLGITKLRFRREKGWKGRKRKSNKRLTTFPSPNTRGNSEPNSSDRENHLVPKLHKPMLNFDLTPAPPLLFPPVPKSATSSAAESNGYGA